MDSEIEKIPLTPARVDDIIPKLALELAMELSAPEDVIARYGLDVQQFASIARLPKFKQTLSEAKESWHSDAAAKDRIQAKATHLVEDAMLEVASIVHDRSKPVASRLDGFKHLSRMARVSGDTKEADASVGSKFSVVINLGTNEDEQKLIFDSPVVNTEDLPTTLEGDG